MHNTAHDLIIDSNKNMLQWIKPCLSNSWGPLCIKWMNRDSALPWLSKFVRTVDWPPGSCFLYIRAAPFDEIGEYGDNRLKKKVKGCMRCAETGKAETNELLKSGQMHPTLSLRRSSDMFAATARDMLLLTSWYVQDVFYDIFSSTSSFLLASLFPLVFTSTYFCLATLDVCEPNECYLTAQIHHRALSADLAQLVERKALNLVVEGSSPSAGDLPFVLT